MHKLGHSSGTYAHRPILGMKTSAHGPIRAWSSEDVYKPDHSSGACVGPRTRLGHGDVGPWPTDP
jgi:hypothetical protein